MEDDWVEAKDNPPKEIGWYKIKSIHGEHEACVAMTQKGDLVWVVPDESIITHYKKIKL